MKQLRIQEAGGEEEHLRIRFNLWILMLAWTCFVCFGASSSVTVEEVMASDCRELKTMCLLVVGRDFMTVCVGRDPAVDLHDSAAP